MANTTDNSPFTAEEYIRSLSPGANVSESTIAGILIDAGIDPETYVVDLTEKQKDLALAYLLIRIASTLLCRRE